MSITKHKKLRLKSCLTKSIYFNSIHEVLKTIPHQVHYNIYLDQIMDLFKTDGSFCCV